MLLAFLRARLPSLLDSEEGIHDHGDVSSVQQKVERHVKYLRRKASLAHDEVGCDQLPVADVLVGLKPSRPSDAPQVVQREPRFARTFAVLRVFVAAIVPAMGKVPPGQSSTSEGRQPRARSEQHQGNVLAPAVGRDAQTPSLVLSGVWIGTGFDELGDDVRAGRLSPSVPRSKLVHGPVQGRPAVL